MKRREKLLMGFVISLVVVLFFSTKAMAVPSFGVATSSGTYLEDPLDPPDSNQTGYINWFLNKYSGDGYVSGGGHGFAFDGSTASFTVFTNEVVADIWLVHENSFRNNEVTFVGNNPHINTTFDLFLMGGNGNGQIDGYTDKNSYWGLNLGPVDTNNGWVALPSNSSNPTGPFNPPTFYAYEGQLSFGNALTDDDLGHYFFSAGDWRDGGNGLIGGGEFSPKTTSAQYAPIPEPTTIALLGIGLVGLVGGAVRRKFKKNN